MRTLLNENLVFELKGYSHLGAFSAGAFPGPELQSSAQGLPSARGTSCFILWFLFGSCSPDCILKVRQDAPDVSSGSLTDTTARGVGVRLPFSPCCRVCRAGAMWLIVRFVWLLLAAAGQKW